MMIFFLILTFIAAYVLTGVVRSYALRKNIVDTPNARSSHMHPTPRGGGVGFVVAFLVMGCLLLLFGEYAEQEFLATLLAASAVAAITGFMDDHRHIPARWRLLAHFFVAAVLLYGLGGTPPISIVGIDVFQGAIATMFGALFIVWMLNLTNFMDGIDGLASIQVMTVSLGGGLLYYLSGNGSLAVVPVLLAASISGFLMWNYPPARIFMGDAGSGFLGVVVAGLTLQAGWIDSVFLWSWLILSGVFIVDATYTLTRRLLRGERVYEAHRSHAYQIASRRLGGHKPVTLIILTVNLFWLLPWAVAVALKWLPGDMGLLLAYAPLLVMAIWLKAGTLKN